MNTKSVKIIALLIIAALALSAPALYADVVAGNSNQREKWSKGKMESKTQELYKDLNLTEEQKKMLDDNKSKHREQMKALFNDMDIHRTAIRQELQKETLDMGKITQLNNEMKKLQEQMLDQKLAGTLEVRKILSPDQFKKFMAKIEEHREHWNHKK